MRPKKERIVNAPPKVLIFKPSGIPAINLEKVGLSIDEFEAIRLADLFGDDQETAAKKMGISRPTFTRLIESARKKVADALINCKELIIEGGNIHFKNNILRCLNCGHIIKISIFEEEPDKCPICGAENLKNMAEHLGHGRCCRKRFGANKFL
jgi:predicted DNA-binding protein (UPF0251 family)